MAEVKWAAAEVVVNGQPCTADEVSTIMIALDQLSWALVEVPAREGEEAVRLLRRRYRDSIDSLHSKLHPIAVGKLEHGSGK